MIPALVVAAGLVVAASIAAAVVAGLIVAAAGDVVARPVRSLVPDGRVSTAVIAALVAALSGVHLALQAVHLVPRERLLHLGALALDRVQLLEHDLVDRIVVVELDEREAALLAGVLLGYNIYIGDRAELLEVLLQVVLLHVLLQATQEDLLHGRLSLRLARVLARHGALRLDLTAVDLVWTRSLRLVDHLRVDVGDEAEASRSLRLRVAHHHAVDDVAPFLEVRPQRVLRGLVVETADEQLAQLLRLVARDRLRLVAVLVAVRVAVRVAVLVVVAIHVSQ